MLRLSGQWFGRPLDNIHTVTGVSADGEALEVRSDKGETLRVVRPARWVMMLLRCDGSGNAYGKTPGRRYFQEYVRKGSVIDATTDVDWYAPRLLPSTAEPAVVIL